MWNLWKIRARVRSLYPLGTNVRVEKIGELPVIDYCIERDDAFVVLDYRGYRLHQRVKV